MKNIQIRKRLKMGSQYSIYDRNQKFNPQSLVLNSQILQKVLNTKNKQSKTLLKAFNNYKSYHQPISILKEQKNGSKKNNRFINFNQHAQQINLGSLGNFFIRIQKSSKQQLVPKPLPPQIKQLQIKINDYSSKQAFKNTRTHSQRNSINKTSNDFNLEQFYKISQIEKGILQKSELKKDKNSHEPTKKLAENNQGEKQWYIRAIQAHLNGKCEKVNLSYTQQGLKLRPKVVFKSHGHNANFHNKLQTGFKKRAVSYEIKYV